MNYFDVLFGMKLEAKKHPAVIKKRTGNPIELTDGADAPMVKCVTEITGYQEGTGTPSPDNVRPITAYTEGEIEVSDGDGNTTTHTTTYPSAIYRGSEDAVNGEVTAVKIKVSKKWSEGTSATVIGDYTRKVFALPSDAVSNDPNAICNLAPRILNYSSDELHFYVATSTALVFLPNDTDGDTDVEIVYELATPITSSVTPTNLPIKSLSGYNHIESSTGEMEIEYIAENYQDFVDVIEETFGNGTRKGGRKAIDVFRLLDPEREPEPKKEEDPEESEKEPEKESKK